MEDKIGEEGLFERIKRSAFVKKLRGAKNLQIVAIIFIIAIGLLIYSNVAARGDRDESATVTQMTSEEQRLSGILSAIEGAGNVEAMISERGGEIVGVLVIADGADDITVRLRLLEAASQALGVPKAVVSVYCRK